MKEMSFVQAVNEGIREEMRRDKSVFVVGADSASGPIGLGAGLAGEFGHERVINAPLSEEGFVGTAIGAAAAGMRPIVDLQLFSFSYVAFDQIVSHAGKLRYMSGGQLKLPIVILGISGAMSGMAAQHAESPQAMYMNAPGLKIAMPTTPYDGKGMLKASVRDDNPVLFFQHSRVRALKGNIPEEDYVVPLGVAEVRRQGTDVTVVGIGGMVLHALTAAEELAKDGISVEVIDPRSLVPLDTRTIFASVKKTNRLVILDDAPRTCGAAAELAALVAEDEEVFGYLDAPIQRVTRVHVPIAFSRPMENYVIPDLNKVTAAIRKVMGKRT